MGFLDGFLLGILSSSAGYGFWIWRLIQAHGNKLKAIDERLTAYETQE